MQPKACVATIVGSAAPNPGTCLLLLACPELAANALPGQFVMVRCAEGYDPYLRYAFPIHRLNPQGIALYLRPAPGAHSWLANRRMGNVLDVLGPCGHGFDLAAGEGSLGLVCQDMGIAPLLAAANRFNGGVQLLQQVATPGQVYPRELLPRQVEFLTFVGHEQHAGFVAAIEAACRWSPRVLLAGSAALYGHARRFASSLPIPRERGWAQAWVQPDLTCGRGICQGCTVETRRGGRLACRHGPAFDLTDVVV